MKYLIELTKTDGKTLYFEREGESKNAVLISLLHEMDIWNIVNIKIND